VHLKLISSKNLECHEFLVILVILVMMHLMMMFDLDRQDVEIKLTNIKVYDDYYVD
jgi:hypothetical protein